MLLILLLIAVTHPMLRRQLEKEHEAPGYSENHQNEGSRDTIPEKQPRTPRARSEAASTTPEVTVPSNRGEREAFARDSRGRTRQSGRGYRAASVGRGADTSTERNPRLRGSAPPSSAGRGEGRGTEEARGAGGVYSIGEMY